MSDFAIGFYSILYKGPLNNNPILDKKTNKLVNNNFAGDTMNSFNSIANCIPESGKKVENRGQTSLCGQSGCKVIMNIIIVWLISSFFR